ncbi:MAG: hypothetical protein CMI36_09485 [Owenweeksia sp.]|nr:hypothetical protein [Owenweeksia sp.]MBF99214.1 hypothetical protein [Owenweeksia sp.]HCQ15289.1 hypothetical protein [Cryomorphaceae bacterium]|tara:strand:- start:447 stop:1103 length:657 start_codon:yes stop_codon:yes gene_type:complete
MTKEEVSAIRRYLRNNGVKYYDVQAELIDHFATAVEEQQKEDPSIPFKVALLKAHREFGGRKGFNDYRDAALKRVKKKITSVLLNSMLSFLGWPLLILTFTIALAWHFYLQWIPEGTMFWPHLLVFQALAALSVWHNHQRLKSIPLYLTRNISAGLYGFFYAPLILPVCFAVNTFKLELHYHWISLLYFSLVSIMLLAAILLPPRLTEETQKQYPSIS